MRRRVGTSNLEEMFSLARRRLASLTGRCEPLATTNSEQYRLFVHSSFFLRCFSISSPSTASTPPILLRLPPLDVLNKLVKEPDVGEVRVAVNALCEGKKGRAVRKRRRGMGGVSGDGREHSRPPKKDEVKEIKARGQGRRGNANRQRCGSS